MEAKKIDADDWFVKYMIANVRAELGQYVEAIEEYRHVLEMRPTEFGVKMAMSDCLVAASRSFIEKGYYGRAAETLVETLKICHDIVTSRTDPFNLWKNVGDTCMSFTWIQSYGSSFPIDLAKNIVWTGIRSDQLKVFSELDGVSLETLDDTTALEGDTLRACITIGLLAYKRAIVASAEDRHAHAVAWYNLGTAEHRAHTCLSSSSTEDFQTAAIRCFKRAIKVEPGNHEFWSALGVATAVVNVRASQHALIRSLYLNEMVGLSYIHV